MNQKISQDDALKVAVVGAEALRSSTNGAGRWKKKLISHLDVIRSGIPERLDEREFLQLLFEEEAVAATGMGSVKTAPALGDESFRSWFKNQVVAILQSAPADKTNALTAFYSELESQLGSRCGRVPRLKLIRALCAIFPDYFTTVANIGMLTVLNRAMGGNSSAHPVIVQGFVRKRLDDVLGTVSPDNKDAYAERLCLPWYLYEYITSEGRKDVPPKTPLNTELSPLPAIFRRKGLTAMKGSFNTLMSFVQVLKDGLTRQEFEDVIRQENTGLADKSLGPVINAVSREFGICSRVDDVYQLSAQGLNLLNTRDPDELAEYLLTHILGIDNILKLLEKHELARPDAIKVLQLVNPGWTASFSPNAMLGWLVSLDVISLIAVSGSPVYRLTERGARWAEKITWEPELLPSEEEESTFRLEAHLAGVRIPQFNDLLTKLKSRIAGQLVYESSLVQELHAGLWFHPVRHFVVLTGISGSGKTQLALNYSLSLCDVSNNDHERVRIIPVQPGWFDPAPLLGYVNPITQTYRSAPFLELILRAAEDPERPYVAILDEMNLSHPEQYLAPILSAMETQGWIDLHNFPDDISDVPAKVRYPANLAIIGTLNMDETTHGLSDKVLDRAYTLEFWNIAVEDSPVWKITKLSASEKEKAKTVLTELTKALSIVRLHFGWRTVSDVLSYIEFYSACGDEQSSALDAAIYAKVLPKVRGEGTTRFQAALQDIQALFKREGLSRCEKKVSELIADLDETGAARFWR